MKEKHISPEKFIIGFVLGSIFVAGIAFAFHFASEKVQEPKEAFGYAGEQYYARPENAPDIYVFPEEYMHDIVEAISLGEKPERSKVEYILKNTYRLMISDVYTDKEGYHDVCLECYAFLKGYLLLTEDEIEFLLENGDERYPTEETLSALADRVAERIGGLQ